MLLGRHRIDLRTKRDLRRQIKPIPRQRHQLAAPFAPESEELLSLAAYLGFQSRGLAVAPDDDPRLTPAAGRGERLFTQRIGQLDLSCAQCHVDQAGRKLGGSTIPQAHPTGYPIYRLEWQAMGSLQRRLRACMTGVRAEPYPFAAQEWVDLEVYLSRRASGLTVETPAVRP
jgi:sulfur-oxidizing protein SoxA